MGYVAFKKAKNVSPIKFQYKVIEKQENPNVNNKFFKQNP
jgi:hypothetical protein